MKSGVAISARASHLGVRRDTSLPVSKSSIYPGLCYADWERACEALKVDITSEEGAKVLKAINHSIRH